MGERILLIEDDQQLGAQITDFLGRAGFEATWWSEGRPLQPGEAATYRLVILDLMLPGTYGMDILRQLREGSDVPVLILSARNDTADKVRALKLGADDYMTKPFWPEELVERIRARLRRPVMQRQNAVELGGLSVDLESHEVRVQGKPVELTRVEFELLAALARRPGAAVTRQWLVENVLDPEREGTERTLDVHVSRLRRKLGPGKHIETVWGIGYRLGDGEGP
ncbi:response regulator transcription factor [Archangium violaceum]|uniref:response regulator transcription factor n=1 Tax=Archangium violaceum TaxID=83451 RepID=UPI0019523E0F|nr:response regulator transcription factor [Archangium violaceum]QRN96431.1 response regulator transcription factor [Archangium violaceum]